MSNTTKGIIALLISSLGFSLMVISLSLVIYYKEKLFGQKKNQGLLLLRSSLGLLGVLLNFFVIDRMVLSDAEILNKLSPFFTILLCALFLKEYIRRYQMISIIIALVGAVFIIKPSMSSDTAFALLGILGAILAAGAYTVLRVLGDREKFYTVVFYFSGFSTVALLPFFIFQYESMTFEQWIMLILAGIFAAFGQFGLTIAYSFAPAREISIFFYSTIIFTALLSIFILNEVPDMMSVIGYFIIFGASYYMFMKNRAPKEEF